LCVGKNEERVANAFENMVLEKNVRNEMDRQNQE
jgi:hypothetical protein